MKLFLTFVLAAFCCAFAQQTELTKTLAALVRIPGQENNDSELKKIVVPS